MKNKLAPSILSADFSNLGEAVKLVEEGGADYIHIDVMDGHYVPNITIGPAVVKDLRKTTSLTFDVHLMIENPDNFIEHFYKAGADIITVHQEATVHLHRTIQKVKSYGIKAGVSLNPATPISGQSLIENVKYKFYDLKQLLNKYNLDIDIEIDGGVNYSNLKEILSWGANVIVAGSAIYHAEDIVLETKKFKEIMS